jgi:hypothetical protein
MPPNLHNQRRENSGTSTCNPASRTLPMCLAQHSIWLDSSIPFQNWNLHCAIPILALRLSAEMCKGFAKGLAGNLYQSVNWLVQFQD